MSALDSERVSNGEPVYDPAAGTGAADLADGPATYDPAAPLPEVSPRSRRSGGGTNGSQRSSGSRSAGGHGRASTRGKKAEKRSRDRDPLEETSDPVPDAGEPIASGAESQDADSHSALDPVPGADAPPTIASPVDLLDGPTPAAPADVADPGSSSVAGDAAEDRSLADAGPPVPPPPIAAAASFPLAPEVTPEPVLGDPPPGSASQTTPEPVAEDLPARPEPVDEDVAPQPAPPAAPESAVEDLPSEPLPSERGARRDDPEAGQEWLDGRDGPEPSPEAVGSSVPLAAPGEAPTVGTPPTPGGFAPTGPSPESAEQLWGSDVTVSAAAPPVLTPPPVTPRTAGADIAPVSAVVAETLPGDATASEVGGRIRRRRMIRSRKVRRVIRHVDPWSVLTFSVIFHLCLFSALLLAGALVWSAAAASGTIENVESFVRDLGDYDTWEIQGDAVLRAGVIIAGMMTLASTVLVVLLTVVFNLISDLIGGIRVTVIEEEVHRVPVPRRK